MKTQATLLLLALLGLFCGQAVSAPVYNAFGCYEWDGSTLTSGTIVQIQTLKAGDLRWVNHGNLPAGVQPHGLWMQSTPANFTWTNPTPFSYNGESGTKGEFYDSGGGRYCSSWGGNFVTYASQGCYWNIAFIPIAPPAIRMYAAQNNLGSSNFGYRLGLQLMNGQTMPDYNKPDYEFKLYICSPPPTPVTTAAATTAAVTTAAATTAAATTTTTTTAVSTTGSTTGRVYNNFGCYEWNGATLASGTVVQIQTLKDLRWMNHGNLPIGLYPHGLWFQSTPANFTWTNPTPFSYNGESGTKGAFYDSTGGYYCSSYGGNFVTYDQFNQGCYWHMAFIPIAPPAIRLYAAQNNLGSGNFGYRMGLTLMNGQTMLDYNKADYEFKLYICS